MDELDQSRADAGSARAQLKETARTIKSRLSPSALKQEAMDKVKARAMEVVDGARARPALTAGLFATAALILLRKPVFGVLKRLTKEK
jgi:Protein of unknown function (DUF3618)